MLDIGLHLMMLFPSNLIDPFLHPKVFLLDYLYLMILEKTILDMHAYLRLH